MMLLHVIFVQMLDSLKHPKTNVKLVIHPVSNAMQQDLVAVQNALHPSHCRQIILAQPVMMPIVSHVTQQIFVRNASKVLVLLQEFVSNVLLTVLIAP